VVGVVLFSYVVAIVPFYSFWTVQALYLPGQVVYWYGLWLITKPNPSGPILESTFTARRLIRIGVLVSMCWLGIAMFLDGMSSRPGVGSVINVVSWLLEFIWIIMVFATLLHLERLAGRIPRDRWAEWLCVLRWTICVVLALGLIQDVAVLLAATSATTPTWQNLLLLRRVTFVVHAAVHLPYLVLLWKLGTAFRKQADLARQSWGISDRGS
jgi:hypothetical protein